MEQKDFNELKKSLIGGVLSFFIENELDIIGFTKSPPIYLEIVDPFDNYRLLKCNLELMDSYGNMEVIHMDGEDSFHWNIIDMDISDLKNITESLNKNEYNTI